MVVGSKSANYRSQVRWSSPEGPFVSSMVLGSKAVDLPYDIRDSFIQVGWLMLCSLWISNFFDSWFGAGVKQASFSGSASWLRRKCFSHFPWFDWFTASSAATVVMGFGALIALAMRRKLSCWGHY